MTKTILLYVKLNTCLITLMVLVASAHISAASLDSLVIDGLDSIYADGPTNFSCLALWSDKTTTDVTGAAEWSTDATGAAFVQNTGVLQLQPGADGTIRISVGYSGMTTIRDVYVKDVPAGSPLVGMGKNSASQLGQDNPYDQFVPVTITDDNVISMGAGKYHAMYVQEDGSLWGMGANWDGELGRSGGVPNFVPGMILPGGALKVACGYYHSLVVMRDGSLWGTGHNEDGQLGDGTRINSDTLVCIERAGVIDVCAGEYHSVFLKSNGDVYTMGRNIEGQLGTGDTLGRTEPFHISLPQSVTQIAAGRNHTLMVSEFMDLFGTGDNSFGQLGIYSSIIQLSQVYFLASSVRAVAAGEDHTLFILYYGELYASGRNDAGQLGDGTTVNRYAFQWVGGYTDVDAVAAGETYSMFMQGGQVSAMGSNSRGQLGNGNDSTALSPVLLPHTDIAAIVCGDDYTLMIQREITGIRLMGPSSVETGDTAVYTCSALWSDDAETDVGDSAAWAIDAGGILVNSTLIADIVAGDSLSSIIVTYGNFSDTFAVAIIPAITGLRIAGPDTVNEDSSGIFSCMADVKYGAALDVSGIASWSVDSLYATVSAGTLFTDTVDADQSVRITAVYEGDTVSIDIVVHDLPVSSIAPVDAPASVGFTVFPNPAARTAEGVNLSIPLTLPGQWSIKAYDALGNLVAEDELDAAGEMTYQLKLYDAAGGRYVIVGTRTDAAGKTETFRQTVGVR